MVQEICKDVLFLARKSEPATQDDLPVAADLLGTLKAHADGCVGMAANMIGVAKRIIAFDDEGVYRVLFNPEIVKKSGPYEAEEGCLSLTGTRRTKRWTSPTWCCSSARIRRASSPAKTSALTAA